MNNYYKNIFYKLFHKYSFIIPLTLLLVLFISSIIFKLTIDESYYLKINLDSALLKPSKQHIFGTNDLGQDLFYQCMLGIFYTLSLAFIATFINTLLGIVIGTLWGHLRKLDNLVILFKSVINNIPLIYFYIILLTIFGNGFIFILFVLIISGWVNLACLIRENLLLIRNKDFNTYSKLNKTPLSQIILYNYLPSLLPIIFTSISLSIPQSVSFEITLSYFNFSLGENSISLGKILYNSISKNLCFSSPYLFFIPLGIVLIINMCFYLMSKSISSVTNKEDY